VSGDRFAPASISTRQQTTRVRLMAQPLNIIIRQAELTDATALWHCYTAPNVVRNTLQLPYRSLESVREPLQKKPEDGHYHLVAEIDGQVVGALGLHVNRRPRLSHVAGFGMMVLDDWQGQGIGSALLQAALDLADQWLNLLRLELTVYTDNTAAIALYKKFGFEIEGTNRNAAFRAGKFVDTLMMARVK
jgi:putative acetyltransferase